MAETFPFGAKTPVFKVAGKMFALSQLAEHPLRVSLKCEPQLAEQQRATWLRLLRIAQGDTRQGRLVLRESRLVRVAPRVRPLRYACSNQRASALRPVSVSSPSAVTQSDTRSSRSSPRGSLGPGPS